MIVRAIKTKKVLVGENTLLEILDEAISALDESNIAIIASKIVSLCENRVVSVGSSDKQKLIEVESDYFLLPKTSKYPDFQFTITQNTLIPNSGIDESNTNGNYLLWPKDPQKTANEIRAHLKQRFGLKKLGVVITDSTCMPLRWGTLGIPIAYSGFAPNNNYIGTKDLFGYEFKVSRSSVAGGLAAAAVVVMGEGTEQTPIAVIDDVPFVQFQTHDPTTKELELFYISMLKDDLFAPFLNSVKWQKGKRSNIKE